MDRGGHAGTGGGRGVLRTTFGARRCRCDGTSADCRYAGRADLGPRERVRGATPTASALPPGTAPIEAPAPGTTVRRCEVLRGTVSRPVGTVLYTAMRNLDNGDPAWYFQDLFTQPAAGSGGPWSGPQFFGSGDGSVGQRYEVLLVAIGYQVAVPDDTESIALGQLVEERNRLASATYERVKGVPAGECEAP